MVWLQYDMSKLTDVGSLTMYADFTRRICYFDCQGKTELFKMILPSDSALFLHVARGNYIMQLVHESRIANANTYEETNEGWVIENESISIQWEENIKGIKKGLTFKKAPLSAGIGCGCSKGCSLSSELTTRCKICTKQCRPCRPKCKCKGLCGNPHNNGGKCTLCKTSADDDTHTQVACPETTYETDSESEDSEEEFDDNIPEGNILDFTDFFGDSGMLELAPISSLLDEFSENVQ